MCVLYTHAQRTAIFYFCRAFRNLANFRHDIAGATMIGRRLLILADILADGDQES